MIDINKISPENLWYVIGYIVADGNLSNDGRHINITSKDYQHLVAIKNLLGIKNGISWKARGGSKEKIYSQIQVSDINFYKYLLKIGIRPKKSLILGELKIDDIYLPDFLRGVIDGDGCISTWTNRTNGHQQWSLRITSGAPIFARWLKNKIEDYFDVQGKLYNHKYKNKKNFINIIKFGKLATKVIIKRTYYQRAFSLNRKTKLSILCLQDENKMVN